MYTQKAIAAFMLFYLLAPVMAIQSVVWGPGAFSFDASGAPIQILDNGVTVNFQIMDANFVIRQEGTPKWYTGAVSGAGCIGHACKLIFQQDGNLVAYLDNVPIWNTGTWNRGSWLVFFDIEPYMVIYDGAFNPIWTTPISPPAPAPKARPYDPCSYGCDDGTPNPGAPPIPFPPVSFDVVDIDF